MAEIVNLLSEEQRMARAVDLFKQKEVGKVIVLHAEGDIYQAYGHDAEAVCQTEVHAQERNSKNIKVAVFPKMDEMLARATLIREGYRVAILETTQLEEILQNNIKQKNNQMKIKLHDGASLEYVSEGEKYAIIKNANGKFSVVKPQELNSKGYPTLAKSGFSNDQTARLYISQHIKKEELIEEANRLTRESAEYKKGFHEKREFYEQNGFFSFAEDQTTPKIGSYTPIAAKGVLEGNLKAWEGMLRNEWQAESYRERLGEVDAIKEAIKKVDRMLEIQQKAYSMEHATPIMVNIWGGQEPAILTTWREIREHGSKPNDRSFGTLNDNSQALFYNGYLKFERTSQENVWYVTKESLAQVQTIEKTLAEKERIEKAIAETMTGREKELAPQAASDIESGNYLIYPRTEEQKLFTVNMMAAIDIPWEEHTPRETALAATYERLTDYEHYGNDTEKGEFYLNKSFRDESDRLDVTGIIKNEDNTISLAVNRVAENLPFPDNRIEKEIWALEDFKDFYRYGGAMTVRLYEYMVSGRGAEYNMNDLREKGMIRQGYDPKRDVTTFYFDHPMTKGQLEHAQLTPTELIFSDKEEHRATVKYIGNASLDSEELQRMGMTSKILLSEDSSQAMYIFNHQLTKQEMQENKLTNGEFVFAPGELVPMTEMVGEKGHQREQTVFESKYLKEDVAAVRELEDGRKVVDLYPYYYINQHVALMEGSLDKPMHEMLNDFKHLQSEKEALQHVDKKDLKFYVKEGEQVYTFYGKQRTDDIRAIEGFQRIQHGMKEFERQVVFDRKLDPKTQVDFSFRPDTEMQELVGMKFSAFHGKAEILVTAATHNDILYKVKDLTGKETNRAENYRAFFNAIASGQYRKIQDAREEKQEETMGMRTLERGFNFKDYVKEILDRNQIPHGRLHHVKEHPQKENENPNKIGQTVFVLTNEGDFLLRQADLMVMGPRQFEEHVKKTLGVAYDKEVMKREPKPLKEDDLPYPNKAQQLMMKKYDDLKEKHPDAMMLFRVGDFYETYKEDAQKASRLLNLTLTKRNDDKTEMVAFPYHALDSYLPRLIRAGQRVAICDQLEDPKLTKTLARRGISELVAPSKVCDYELIYSKEKATVTFKNVDAVAYQEEQKLAAIYRGKMEVKEGKEVGTFPNKRFATDFAEEVVAMNKKRIEQESKRNTQSQDNGLPKEYKGNISTFKMYNGNYAITAWDDKTKIATHVLTKEERAAIWETKTMTKEQIAAKTLGTQIREYLQGKKEQSMGMKM